MLKKLRKKTQKILKYIRLKILILLIVPPIILTISIPLTTCTQPKLVFEPIVISENIEKDTNKPINPKTEFEITSEQIYATIKYAGAKGNDIWRFKWFNKDFEEVVLDSSRKYNENFPNSYFQGIIASNIVAAGQPKIFKPGIYIVEFYHNEDLKQSTSFTVLKPEISILEVSTANEIDFKGSPVKITSLFNINQIVYVCIKLNYLITGNKLKIFWKKANQIIGEEETIITSDYYDSSYIWFNLKLNKNLKTIEPGNYKAEIYLNDKLCYTADFEIKP